MASTSLATRVAAQRDPDQRQAVSLREQLMNMTDQYQLAMPRGMEAAQLIRDAFTCLSATPKLADCDAKSVMGGLMTCAQLGLRPAVLGQAWLLPMRDWRSGITKAQLIIGYQGYVELVHRSRRVAKITARMVHEGDEFSVRYGDNERLKHKPVLFDDRGEVIAYYATAVTVPKARTFQVMTAAEMREHRDKFAMAKRKLPSGDLEITGPWRDHFDAMALKTVVLRLAKLLPKSTELMTAMAVDGSVRVDVSPRAELLDVSEVLEGETVSEAEEAVDPWADAAAQAQAAAAEAGYEG